MHQQLPLHDTTLNSGATFSHCRTYRYTLWRIEDESKPLLMYVCLNPSTADEHKDDHTITRLRNFTRGWGYGGFYICNLYAYRATSPKDLMSAKRSVDIEGGENTISIVRTVTKCQDIVCAWGNDGSSAHFKKYYQYFKERELKCFGTTRIGEPKHPLYLSNDSQLIDFIIK